MWVEVGASVQEPGGETSAMSKVVCKRLTEKYPPSLPFWLRLPRYFHISFGKFQKLCTSSTISLILFNHQPYQKACSKFSCTPPPFPKTTIFAQNGSFLVEKKCNIFNRFFALNITLAHLCGGVQWGLFESSCAVSIGVAYKFVCICVFFLVCKCFSTC